MKVIQKCLDTCKTGRLLVGVMILYCSSTISNSYNYNDGFINSCMNGRLTVAKWLLYIKPDIDISAYNEHAFRMACSNGHIKVAKWLLSIKPNINVFANFDYAFRCACYDGHLHVAKFLQTLIPFKYVIQTNNKPFIRTYKEANKLLIITMFEKTGYMQYMNAELLCNIVKNVVK